MKLIKHYKYQRTDIKPFLEAKGYRYKRDFHLEDQLVIRGTYSKVWRLCLPISNSFAFDVYIIVEQVAKDFDIFIIELEEIANIDAVKIYLETGEQPDFDKLYNPFYEEVKHFNNETN